MEKLDLVTFLANEAVALVSGADAGGVADRDERLDEAAELLALAANVVARRAVSAGELRKAA